MMELLQRLQALRPIVHDIMQVSGTAGCSIGVIHDAKVLLTENFGYREIPIDGTPGKEPTDETIYYLASLSKSFTATAAAILVKEGKFTWDTPISHLLSDLQHHDPEIRDHASLLDLLSHRAGLAPKNHLWSQEFGHMSLRRGETIRTVTYLEKIADFRSRWIYNNWGYGVADVLIDRLSGHTWGEFLKKRVFEPLGMRRTVTKRTAGLGNFAQGYMALSNGRLYPIPDLEGSDDDIIEGALSVRSCVKDLLQYYLKFLEAVKQHEQRNEQQSQLEERDGARTTPFVDAGVLIEPHIKLSTESPDLDGSYGMGWVRARLPCTLGAIGLNHAFLDRMPVVGRGLRASTTCLYHQGSANSYLSSVYLLPDTQSGVIVLTNSMSRNDAADWLGELYLETILDNPHKNDYARLARNSASAAMKLWPAMAKELADNQVANTPIRPFVAYMGKYYNIIGNYHLEIKVEKECLVLYFQREKRIGYKLTHYHYDSFTWLITHDQDVHVGRFPITRASYYLLHFKSQGDDPTKIDSVVWAHDDEVLEGETFFKKDGQASDILQEIRAEDRTIPAANTVFTPKATEVRKEVVMFPEGQELVRQDGGKLGVLLNTQLDELTSGVHDGVRDLDRAAKSDTTLKLK